MSDRPLFGYGARKQIARGDLIASFQYIPVMDERRQQTGDREPGVIIMRAIDVPKANAGQLTPKVIIGLSAAHKYTVDSYLVSQAHKYAHFLGFGDSRFAAIRIADLLNDMLIELCTMKPERNENPERVEVSIRPDGGFHVEVAEPGLH